MKFDLLGLHNANRGRIASTPLLTMSDKLEPLAQSHATWMAINNRLSHYEGNKHKTSLNKRVLKAGFSYTDLGENIAEGFTTAKGVFDSWMLSYGHKRNILDPRYTSVGFGIQRSPKTGLLFWCVIFGRPAQTNLACIYGGIVVPGEPSGHNPVEVLSGPLYAENASGLKIYVEEEE